jgi:oligopeptide/dipeptide ABC transporter ATP-binding protein
VAARPRIDETVERLAAIPGRPLSAFEAPPGCSFQTRCPHVADRCRETHPALRPSPAGVVRCIRAEEIHHG